MSYDHRNVRARVEAAFKLRGTREPSASIVDDVIEIVQSIPVPMRLACPMCHVLHIDTGEFETKPHHTHACQHCGNVWRPALVPTVGVQFLPGFKNASCDFRFSDPSKRCISTTCHIDGKHYTDGVIP